jgi:DNA excision repair protein ERCC-3
LSVVRDGDDHYVEPSSEEHVTAFKKRFKLLSPVFHLQKLQVFRVEIHAERNIRRLFRLCNGLRDDSMSFQLISQFAYGQSRVPSDFPILKTTTTLHYYQREALDRMFARDRVRSGPIVLPCGSNKTLVGVSAAMKLARPTFVVCTRTFAVSQWAAEFRKFTTTDKSNILEFIDKNKTEDYLVHRAKTAQVVITTYSILAILRPEKQQTNAVVIDALRMRDWFHVLDETHKVAALQFRSLCTTFQSHTRLGLSATLVYGDDNVDDLTWLVGPRIYEDVWMELQDRGYIARAHCYQVNCAMPPEKSAKLSSPRAQQLSYHRNPAKFKACKYLAQSHALCGHKVLIFFQGVDTLKQYARKLRVPFICGETDKALRQVLFDRFKNSLNVNGLCATSLADDSIDLPNANVIIQVSSHFASQQQEAQRLGRIIRRKKSGPNEA